MLLLEVRQACRRLLRQPLFSACVIAVLALAIGANSAMFALVNAILLRPLPFANPDRLITFSLVRPGTDRQPLSLLDAADIRESSRTLESLALMFGWSANLTGSGDAERLSGMRVSANYFEVTGTPVALGRAIQQDDEQRPVALIGHGLWQRRFGGASDVVGNSVILNGEAFTIVGVLRPDAVTLVRDAEVVVPFSPSNDPRRANRSQGFLRVIAKLRPGVTVDQAAGDLTAITQTLRERFPDSHGTDTGMRVVSMHDEISGRTAPTLRLLFAAVMLVLLVACANLANLFLVKGAASRRELALRTALGGSRARIVLHAISETVILAIAGGALGLLAAQLLIDALVAAGPANLPRVAEIGIDLRVGLFTLMLSLATSVLVGLVPAMQSARGDVRDALQEGQRGSSAAGTRLRTALVFAEVALSAVLLMTAALLARSFQYVQAVDPGFQPRHVLTIRLSLPRARYAGRAAIESFYHQLQPKIAALPGVRTVAAANVVPMNGYLATTPMYLEGMTAKEAPDVHYRMISPDYFQALGIALRRGRPFTLSDRSDSAPVVIINETLARQFFANRDPLNSRIRLDDGGKVPREVQVVGVVNDVRHFGLEREATIEVYVPMSQVPDPTTIWLANNMYWVISTAGEPLAVANAVRREIATIDPAVPASFVRSMDQWMDTTLAPRRFNLTLVEAFAAAALLLAVVGVYAVTAFAVAARTREIGIRVALGSSRYQVIRLVLRGALAPVLIALASGTLVAVLTAPALSEMLFGVTPADAASLAMTVMTLASTALVATLVPALRAAHVDPVVALRID